MYIISACLLGKKCKYDGGDNACLWVKEFAETHRCIPVCPETAGGLKSPRPPAEIISGRVIDCEGKDVTSEFRRGAEAERGRAKAIAAKEGEEIKGAILKANSPSCGARQIYDGTFSGKTVPGDGVFARLLKDEGIDVITEKESFDDKL